MAFGILVTLYAVIIGVIIGIVILALKLLFYACIGIFFGMLWIGEKVVKCLFRPLRRR